MKTDVLLSMMGSNTDGEKIKVVKSPMICKKHEQMKITKSLSGMKCDESLLVTQMEAHVLVKNKAERIRDIEKVTSTEISIRGGNYDTKRKVVIRGLEHNIEIARLKLKEATHGVKCENLLLTNIEAGSLFVNRDGPRGEII